LIEFEIKTLDREKEVLWLSINLIECYFYILYFGEDFMEKLFKFSYMLILGWCLSIPGWSYPYSEIYVFGDSLSDTGRLFKVTGIPSEPYFAGRSSNGPVWVEQLAAYLDLNYNPQTNFAWVGATTGTVNVWNETFPDAELFGLQQQVDTYIDQTTAADAEALYVVWAGANDFSGEITDPQLTVSNAVSNIVTAVTKLRQHGAQHIFVANLPDLGKTPRGLASGMSELLSALTHSFNQALVSSLQSLEVMQVDMLAALAMLTDSKTITDPVKLNLHNFTEACFNSELPSICDTPNNYFYWDDIHPTTQGHFAIALLFYAVVADPKYVNNTLFMPVVKLAAGENYKLIFNAQMYRDLEDNRFVVKTTGSSILTEMTYQSLITSPLVRQYPTYNTTTDILSLPIVLVLDKENVVCVAAPCHPILNVEAKYKVDLTLIPETLDNPFKVPSFILTNADLLE
jgi:phospholipase/lecithinase/hemolysin